MSCEYLLAGPLRVGQGGGLRGPALGETSVPSRLLEAVKSADRRFGRVPWLRSSGCAIMSAVTDHAVPHRPDGRSSSHYEPDLARSPDDTISPVRPAGSAGAIARARASVGPGDGGGRNPRVQRAVTPAISPGPLVQRSAYAHGTGEVLAKPLANRAAFVISIEELLDNTFVGIRALFTAGGVATSIEAWGNLLHGLLEEDYEMDGYTPSDCAEVVENLKAEHRKEQFLGISEFYGYFEDSYESEIWTLDELKSELQKHSVLVDEEGKDDATLKALLAARGDRTQLEQEPQHAFQFRTATESLDVAGLKAKLDTLLGTKVNWGHEITDCMDDSGKRGEMYYYRRGEELTQVGERSQSHASSQGGRTIIWEQNGTTTEILAIGKHTDRANNKLSSGASYEIEETFSLSYAGYAGKIIGFKA